MLACHDFNGKFGVGMSEPAEPTAHSAVGAAFREVCDHFRKLCRSDNTIPVWGGNWVLFKYQLRHPVRWARQFRPGWGAQLNAGELVPFFPVDAMTCYLQTFSETQLKSLKVLCEIRIRRIKSGFADNIYFKFSVYAGSAYALLEASDKLVKVSGTQIEFLNKFLALPFVQQFIGSLLVAFIVLIVVLAAKYVIYLAPDVRRAQVLDDLIQIALEEKRFSAPSASDNLDAVHSEKPDTIRVGRA